MRPINHGILLVVTLSFSFIGLVGCGEKRIHVATLSGAPGEEKTSSITDELDLTSDREGLSGTAVEESSLAGTTPSTEEVRADAVLPVAPVEPLHFAHEPSLPSSSDEPSMQDPQLPLDTPSETEPGPALAEGNDLSDPMAPGQNIETQSGSLQEPAEASTMIDSAGLQEDQSNPPAGSNATPGDSHLSLAEPAEPSTDQSLPGNSQLAFAEPAKAFQDDSFQQPDENHSIAEASQMAQFDNDELSPHLTEQIPDKVQLAKAEPSDILREQLNKIKEEELATASAGLEDVFFQFDSWTLTAEAKESLERDMGWLSNEPSSSLIIEGHADQRGTQAYNMILGKKRAMAIRDYLSQLGVEPSRLTVISYGKDKPFCQDLTEVCHQLNRRGHLLVQN